MILYLQNPIKIYLDLLFGTRLEWSDIICLSKLGSLLLCDAKCQDSYN